MTESKKELAATKKRISELDGLIRGLYEDRQLGHMPARQVDRLIAQYDQEQEELESKVSSLEVKIEEEKSGRSDPERFLKAIRKYRDFDELTQDMVFELIDRIDVHQADMDEETGERSQQIDITFSFIGSYAVRSSLFDVGVCLVFGLLGWLLSRSKIPVSPIVLGMILGTMIEKNLRTTIMMGGVSLFFQRPLSLTLLVLAFASVVIPFIREKKRTSGGL